MALATVETPLVCGRRAVVQPAGPWVAAWYNIVAAYMLGRGKTRLLCSTDHFADARRLRYVQRNAGRLERGLLVSRSVRI